MHERQSKEAELKQESSSKQPQDMFRNLKSLEDIPIT